MRRFKVGDLVLLINSDYNSDIIGHVGLVAQAESFVTGFDKYGSYISNRYVVVDLPDDINRHGTTLWYLKSHHLIKISPDAKEVVTASMQYV
jgi:hypothetical protein